MAIDPAWAAWAETNERITAMRGPTERRIHRDPHAHAVAQMLRRLVRIAANYPSTQQEREAILDATGAIMAMLDEAREGKTT